jgi:hypothetical protein
MSKLAAHRKLYDIVLTEATFQLDMSWLKALAPANMEPISTRAAVFQHPKFWLNAAAL